MGGSTGKVRKAGKAKGTARGKAKKIYQFTYSSRPRDKKRVTAKVKELLDKKLT